MVSLCEVTTKEYKRIKYADVGFNIKNNIIEKCGTLYVYLEGGFHTTVEI